VSVFALFSSAVGAEGESSMHFFGRIMESWLSHIMFLKFMKLSSRLSQGQHTRWGSESPRSSFQPYNNSAEASTSLHRPYCTGFYSVLDRLCYNKFYTKTLNLSSIWRIPSLVSLFAAPYLLSECVSRDFLVYIAFRHCKDITAPISTSHSQISAKSSILTLPPLPKSWIER
jgi:hypothetical protein